MVIVYLFTCQDVVHEVKGEFQAAETSFCWWPKEKNSYLPDTESMLMVKALLDYVYTH